MGCFCHLWQGKVSKVVVACVVEIQDGASWTRFPQARLCFAAAFTEDYLQEAMLQEAIDPGDLFGSGFPGGGSPGGHFPGGGDPGGNPCHGFVGPHLAFLDLQAPSYGPPDALRQWWCMGIDITFGHLRKQTPS